MSRTKSKVTVVIPTYNRAEILKTTIDSVRNQTIKNFQILVIDDGSTDHTKKVVKAYQKKDKRIVYFSMPNNMGICHVLNQALELVDTKYMVQVDSDDWLQKNALKILISAMQKQPPTTALAYGNYKVWRGPDQGKLYKNRSFTSAQKYEVLLRRVLYCPRFYRTSCLRQVGGWKVNDKYGSRYLEDRRIMFSLIEHYDFIWINKYLYNVRRYDKQHLSAKKNASKYAEVKKNLIIDCLEKWGNEYKASFSNNKNGFLLTYFKPAKKQ